LHHTPTLPIHPIRPPHPRAQKSGPAAFEDLTALVTTQAAKVRDLVGGAAKAVVAKAGGGADAIGAPAAGGWVDTVKDYLQLWITLASLYYLDQTIKTALVQVGGVLFF